MEMHAFSDHDADQRSEPRRSRRWPPLPNQTSRNIAKGNEPVIGLKVHGSKDFLGLFQLFRCAAGWRRWQKVPHSTARILTALGGSGLVPHNRQCQPEMAPFVVNRFLASRAAYP
jgi:hypothetical protein